jgi:membrane protein required for beta-lactamase induction
MVERTNEQQKVLEKRRADLADRRKAQLEVAAQLEAQEEMGEELGKTYTSLQQEVGQIQIVFCLLLVLLDALVTVLNCGTIPS